MTLTMFFFFRRSCSQSRLDTEWGGTKNFKKTKCCHLSDEQFILQRCQVLDNNNLTIAGRPGGKMEGQTVQRRSFEILNFNFDWRKTYKTINYKTISSFLRFKFKLSCDGHLLCFTPLNSGVLVDCHVNYANNDNFSPWYLIMSMIMAWP